MVSPLKRRAQNLSKPLSSISDVSRASEFVQYTVRELLTVVSPSLPRINDLAGRVADIPPLAYEATENRTEADYCVLRQWCLPDSGGYWTCGKPHQSG